MIKDFNDLILFLYFSRQKLEPGAALLENDPLGLVIPQLQTSTPQQIQSKFSEGIYDYILFRLCTLVKFELLDILTSKGVTLKNDQFNVLITEAKKIASPDSLYILDIIDSLRLLRNSAEYRKGVVGQRDTNQNNQLNVLYLVFEL